MELSYLKKLWLKLIACICCTKDHEIPKEQTKPVESTQQTEQATDSEAPSENDPKRMFHGALSTRVQGQLFLGIEQSNHLIIKDALEHGADVNKPINGLDPLEYAIKNGKDYIIEFLLEAGAEIKERHIELAETYQRIYETNLNDHDIVFAQAKDSRPILHQEIREYFMISNTLKQELARQNRLKSAENQALACAATEAKAAPTNSPKAVTTGSVPLSTRPRVVTFVEPKSNGAAAAASSNNADN